MSWSRGRPPVMWRCLLSLGTYTWSVESLREGGGTDLEQVCPREGWSRGRQSRRVWVPLGGGRALSKSVPRWEGPGAGHRCCGDASLSLGTYTWSVESLREGGRDGP